MEAFLVALSSVWADSGFSALTSGHVIMIVVGLVLLYMAIGKGFEPLLLSPIAFGCILANIPKNGFEEPGVMSVIMWYSPRSIPAVDLLGRRRYDRLRSSAG